MTLKQAIRHASLRALALAGQARHGRTSDLRRIRQFVLLQYAPALGSVVHATPLVSALCAAVPEAEITVCASGFARELFRGNPAVDRLVETPDPNRELMAAARAIRGALPRHGDFATFTTAGNERSAIGVAAALAGARNLIGFTLVPELFRQSFDFDYGLSQIANNLRLVEALGHTCGHFEPEVFFAVDDLEYVRGLLRQFEKPRRPLAVLVTQTSVTQRKSWRAERFVEVARMLRDRHGMNLVLVGAGSEREGVARLAEQIGAGARSVAGETSLPQLAALLSLCRVGVTLDTGTMHIGRAMGLPMVIIAPAWSPPIEWLPVDDPRFVILKNRDMDSTAVPEGYVIDEVSVAEVVAGLEQLLAARRHASGDPLVETH